MLVYVKHSCYSKVLSEICTVIRKKLKCTNICYFYIGYFFQKCNYLLRLFDLPNWPSNGIHQKRNLQIVVIQPENICVLIDITEYLENQKVSIQFFCTRFCFALVAFVHLCIYLLFCLVFHQNLMSFYVSHHHQQSLSYYDES